MKSYYVYILTNKNKNVLYTGVTNDLKRRVWEHLNQQDNKKSFTYRYNCFFLVYYEEHRNINRAIEREKEIKGWKRFKKENLIDNFNPGWKFLNNEID
jgi:putative endonuclease